MDVEGRADEVALLAGGHASEHRISLRSGETLIRALADAGFRVHPVIIACDGRWNLLAPQTRSAAPRVLPDEIQSVASEAIHSGGALEIALRVRELGIRTVVLGLHGKGGEDGTIQGFLEVGGFEYAGSGVGASAVALDKLIAKRVMISAGLPTPAHREIRREEAQLEVPAYLDGIAAILGWPLVVKAPGLGSSVEVHIATDRAELRRALRSVFRVERRALVERFIAGREFTCAVINENGAPVALPVVEIIPKRAAWFDLESKYAPGGAEEIVPASLDASTTERIQCLACKLHGIIGARGVSRTDLILDARGEAWILEINTLPGMTAASLVPKALAAAGWELSRFARHLVLEAREGRGAEKGAGAERAGEACAG